MAKKQDLEKLIKESGLTLKVLDERLLNNQTIDIAKTPYNQEQIIFQISDGILDLTVYYRNFDKTKTTSIGGVIGKDKQNEDNLNYLKLHRQVINLDQIFHKSISNNLNDNGIENELTFDGINMKNDSGYINGSGTIQMYTGKEYTINKNEELNKLIKNEAKTAIIGLLATYECIRMNYGQKSDIIPEIIRIMGFNPSYSNLIKNVGVIDRINDTTKAMDNIKTADTLLFKDTYGRA